MSPGMKLLDVQRQLERFRDKLNEGHGKQVLQELQEALATLHALATQDLPAELLQEIQDTLQEVDLLHGMAMKHVLWARVAPDRLQAALVLQSRFRPLLNLVHIPYDQWHATEALLREHELSWADVGVSAPRRLQLVLRVEGRRLNLTQAATGA